MEKTKFKERFTFLRANTNLGPIAAYKLSKLKEGIEKARYIYYKKEGYLMDFDFDIINEYEYELRFAAWKHKCMKLWTINSGELSLTEFAEKTMDQRIAWDKVFDNFNKKVRKLK